MLKCDFHMHSLEDPSDVLKHDAFDLIDHAAQLSYDVLALTLHGKQHYPSELQEYAKSKGILLLPGMEAYVEEREFLVLGSGLVEKEIKKLKSFAEVNDYKKERQEEILIVAPHPFYGLGNCVGDKLELYPDLFDAVEYCHFYTSSWNPNRRAEKIAANIGKPMLACSDTHRLDWMKDHYFFLEAQKNQKSIFEAVRQKRVKNVTRPLGHVEFAAHFWWHAFVQTPLKVARRKGWIQAPMPRRGKFN